MNFNASEEQRLLTASIERFIARDYGFDARRRIVASSDGYSRAIWKTLAELGWLGLTVPTELGGLGGGAADLAAVMDAIGSALIVEPFLATALATRIICKAGSSAQKNDLLPAIAAGELVLAFAHSEERARYNLAYVTTRATKTADGFAIHGEKRVVVHAPCAQMFVVSARLDDDDSEADGIALFLLQSDAPGLSVARYRTLDELAAADVTFDGVTIAADAQIGGASTTPLVIEDAIDYATALLCTEAVGAIRYANDATLDYLKTREQFGVSIGSFQALQHRMVDMVIECEQATSMASLACAAVDGEIDPGERKRIVSAAKIRIADACRRVSQESVQLHGGMGMSDELKISHTFRRLTMIAQQFGDADHHFERFAHCGDA